ncbi:hypothetical protein F5148DRAFT_313866 [Russula earlei]|uniref:Uncharacterized protein n=1 Tax=Russula earlei TaxID=71964 RepID=A0ACC0U3N9_9AGAM|nr:hypothetical protein F5148DRAFT_313866 [Russula earlei]
MTSLPFDPAQVLGLLLIAILLNAYFFGVVTQQLYQYWNSRFEDPVYVKAFVIVQFLVVVLQAIMDWMLAWNVYIFNYNLIINPKSVTWPGLANSLCQVVLIMMANTFLAVRIHTLTQSRVQSGLVLAFSLTAFVIGVVSLVTTWHNKSALGGLTYPERAVSITWHVTQAVTECLIMLFLSRSLLASRSGLKRSDSIVHHLVRNVIQIGLFATIWSMVTLGTFTLLPHNTAYSIFDGTSGLIYTHMIYDGLLSRTRLRTRMADRSQLEMGLPSQSISHTSQSHTSERKRTSGAVDQAHGVVSLVTMGDFATGTQNASDPSGIDKYANSEFEAELAGKSTTVYDIPG